VTGLVARGVDGLLDGVGVVRAAVADPLTVTARGSSGAASRTEPVEARAGVETTRNAAKRTALMPLSSSQSLIDKE
jgi:hypothetical protein